MSCINIDAIEFKPKNGEITWGFKAYDDYSKTYENTLNQEDIQLNDLELLRKIIKEYISESEDLTDMFSLSMSLELGMLINGNYYDFEDWYIIYQECFK